jgi:chaperonin cofactor prefoldin
MKIRILVDDLRALVEQSRKLELGRVISPVAETRLRDSTESLQLCLEQLSEPVSEQEQSYSELQTQIRNALWAKYGEGIWVRDLYDDHCIYEQSSANAPTRLFDIDYAVLGDEIEFGEPVEVKTKIIYTPVSEAEGDIDPEEEELEDEEEEPETEEVREGDVPGHEFHGNQYTGGGGGGGSEKGGAGGKQGAEKALARNVASQADKLSNKATNYAEKADRSGTKEDFATAASLHRSAANAYDRAQEVTQDASLTDEYEENSAYHRSEAEDYEQKTRDVAKYGSAERGAARRAAFEKKVARAAEEVEEGDVPGHEFHGNQYSGGTGTGGGGTRSEARLAKQAKDASARAEKYGSRRAHKAALLAHKAAAKLHAKRYERKNQMKDFNAAEKHYRAMAHHVSVIGGAQRMHVSSKEESSRQVEFTSDLVPLVENAVRKDGTVQLKVIAPGKGSSGFYTREVLSRDGPKVVTKGTKMFWDHPTAQEESQRPERSLRDLAGEITEDAKYMKQGPLGEGLYAKAKVFGDFKDAINELAPHIGVSIRGAGRTATKEVDGKRERVVEEVVAVQSVDFVTAPGAGGKVIELFESYRPSLKEGDLPGHEFRGNQYSGGGGGGKEGGQGITKSEIFTKAAKFDPEGNKLSVRATKLSRKAEGVLNDPSNPRNTAEANKAAAEAHRTAQHYWSETVPNPDGSGGRVYRDGTKAAAHGIKAQYHETKSRWLGGSKSERGSLRYGAGGKVIEFFESFRPSLKEGDVPGHEFRGNQYGGGGGGSEKGEAGGKEAKGQDTYAHAASTARRADDLASEAEGKADDADDGHEGPDVPKAFGAAAQAFAKASEVHANAAKLAPKGSYQQKHHLVKAGAHKQDSENWRSMQRGAKYMESAKGSAVNLNEREVDMTVEELEKLQESHKKLETESKAKDAELAKLKEATVLREAGGIVNELVDKTKLPDAAKARIREAFSTSVPSKDGALDKDALKTLVEARIKSEVDYLTTITGKDPVAGFGAAKKEESVAPAESVKKLQESMQRLGLNEKAAKIAAEGR